MTQTSGASRREIADARQGRGEEQGDEAIFIFRGDKESWSASLALAMMVRVVAIWKLNRILA